MSNYTITGTICHIGQTIQVSDKFTKREFVLQVNEEFNGNVYPQYISLQLTQNKCALIDNYAEGHEITASFNLKGRKWEKDGKTSYFNTIEAWKLESTGTKTQHPTHVRPKQGVNNYTPSPADNFTGSPENVDDLPF